jgi:FKBP-type peptidyl-prolyl cis-trans isomerase FkpA
MNCLIMRNNPIFYFLVLVIFCPGCRSNKENALTRTEFTETQKALVGANRLMVQKDREKIREYSDAHKLEMKESPTGLWYRIYAQGNGKVITSGQTVTLRYKVSLLDGTPCYDSDSLGPKQFRVGQGGVEAGLEEGLLMLHPGAKALFIMPPHLADGLPGDGNKIPARAIIMYEVEVIKVAP